MVDLFNRVGSLFVGDTSVEFGPGRSLRASFSVKKTVSTEDPNTAEIEIYNLNEKTRKRIDQVTDSTLKKMRKRVVLEAGYPGAVGSIFIGEAVEIASRRTPTDWITKVIAASGRGMTRTKVNRSFAKGTAEGKAIEQIIQDCANETVVATKEALAAIKAGKAEDALGILKQGLVVSGDPDRILKQLGDRHGINITVDDERIVVFRKGEAALGATVFLDETTGLIGAPERISDDKRPKLNLIRFEALLDRRINLGGAIQIDSVIRGLFRAEEIEHIGDTHGDAWHTRVEAREVNPAIETINDSTVQTSGLA